MTKWAFQQTSCLSKRGLHRPVSFCCGCSVVFWTTATPRRVHPASLQQCVQGWPAFTEIHRPTAAHGAGADVPTFFDLSAARRPYERYVGRLYVGKKDVLQRLCLAVLLHSMNNLVSRRCFVEGRGDRIFDCIDDARGANRSSSPWRMRYGVLVDDGPAGIRGFDVEIAVTCAAGGSSVDQLPRVGKATFHQSVLSIILSITPICGLQTAVMGFPRNDHG